MSGPAKLYSDYLVREGYRPTIDSDGDVVFKHEGGMYYIDIDTSDTSYFRLVYPAFWSIESAEELARAVLAANEATWKTKVAKVYVIDAKNTSAAVEMFFERPEQFAPVFRRAMSALQASVRNFVEVMRS
jgi:predicted aspartyl protease